MINTEKFQLTIATIFFFLSSSHPALTQTCTFPAKTVRTSVKADGIKYEMVKPCYRIQNKSVSCEVLLTNTGSEAVRVTLYARPVAIIDNEGNGYQNANLSLLGARLSNWSAEGTLVGGIPTKLLIVFSNVSNSLRTISVLQIETPKAKTIAIKNPGYNPGKQ